MSHIDIHESSIYVTVFWLMSTLFRLIIAVVKMSSTQKIRFLIVGLFFGAVTCVTLQYL